MTINQFSHVLLWSQSQDALHIESVADMLSANGSAFAANRPMDYVPLAFGTDDECHAGANKVRAIMEKRNVS